MWLLLMVRGKTTMKLKHTLKDVMSLLPKHHGIFSLLECMKGHRLSHALPCTSLECIRLCTMIMPVFLKLLIASKTRKQRSPNTSKPILITPWPKKVTYMDFPSVFTWTNGMKKWTIRQIGCFVERLYFVSPSANERHFLRTLLIKVKVLFLLKFFAQLTVLSMTHSNQRALRLVCITRMTSGMPT